MLRAFLTRRRAERVALESRLDLLDRRLAGLDARLADLGGKVAEVEVAAWASRHDTEILDAWADDCEAAIEALRADVNRRRDLARLRDLGRAIVRAFTLKG